MEAQIINLIVALVTGIVKVAQATGEKVDLAAVMAKAAAAAGCDLQEYEKQLAAQKALFPQG